MVTPEITLTVDQVPISQPTIPDKASYISEVTPVEDASVRLHGGDYDKILVDSASKEAESSPETTAMDQVKTIMLKLNCKRLDRFSIKCCKTKTKIRLLGQSQTIVKPKPNQLLTS